ncbi:hypothetical protein ACHAO7_009390 [Fusarium culmorum]
MLPAINSPKLSTSTVVREQVDMHDPADTMPQSDGYSAISPPASGNMDDLASYPAITSSDTGTLPVGVDQVEEESWPAAGNKGPDGAIHYGNLTHFKVGNGACGQDSTGQDVTGNIVTPSRIVFDAADIDNNPLCGRTITIEGQHGKTAYGTILD